MSRRITCALGSALRVITIWLFVSFSCGSSLGDTSPIGLSFHDSWQSCHWQTPASYYDIHGVRLTLFESRHRSVSGLDCGIGLNDTDSLNGLQFAVCANAVGMADMSGIQMAGIGNVAPQFSGIQLSGLANLGACRDASYGLQSAGFINASFIMISKDTKLPDATLYGGQVSLVGNGAIRVVGAQIALLNSAYSVAGGQLGLVNIARGGSVLQLGLINVIKAETASSIWPLMNWRL